MTRPTGDFLLSPKTEYQREFVWKREEIKTEIDNKKPLVPLEYLTEYRREFTNPKEKEITATAAKVTATTSINEKVSVEESPSKVIVENQQKEVKETVQVEINPHTTLEKSTSTPKIAVKDTSTETGDAQKKQVVLVADKAAQKERVDKVPDVTAKETEKKEESKIDSINTIEPAKPKSKPVMAPYGIGNVHPVIPEHHMKTFNVRAPQDQVTFINQDIYHYEVAQYISAVIP
jgi:hypothetical protein